MSDHITIKVTDGETKSYFVHFNRETHALIAVFEYRQIYTPKMGQISTRNAIIVNLAKSRIGMPLETQGDTSEDHV